MTGSIGLALVGAGAWGRLLAGQAQHAAGLVVRGVADASEDAARRAAAELDARAYPSLEAALDDDGVRAVAVATPNDLHAEVALAAIASGRHVLLEKPMALTVADAERLVRSAAAAGVVLMVDHVQRYYEPLVELQRLVAGGTLGEVQAVAVSRRDHLHRTKAWLQTRRRVGGLLYQSTCHEYDLLRWLCGEAVEISCVAGPSIIASDTLDYPDTILSQLRFACGAAAQVWSCMTDPLMGYDGVVTGSEGTAWFDLYDARLRYRRFDASPEGRRFTPPDAWAPWAWMESGSIASGEAEALRRLLVDFARAVSGEAPPALSGEDGLRAVELAQAGYLSLAERRPVELPLTGDDRSRRTYLDDAAAAGAPVQS